MSFSEKLKELRKEKGLTQEELAKEIFVSRTLISKYENGAIYPTKENAIKIAEFFKVDLSYLIDSNETVGIILKNSESTADKVHKILNCLIIYFASFINVLFFLPIVHHYFHDYSHGTPPIVIDKFALPMIVTLSNGDPICLINFILLIVNIVLSIFTFKYKKSKALKVCNYVLFALNIILTFFFIVMSYYHVNSIHY